ncbi:hypothetical protein [Leptolyngbya sp. FACHB-261]|uniref:hypothetical protein n=1 Tax=Leptolyngbya sp. FACHB-261 TaxID=2692806 RepID=UPI001689CCDD|nr:hypothetical protein [Leptolyngbya sp. FACHB-261]MBD2101100.1 hypothetical protein [Leptolyngbya sp. FACHB-261]
MNPDQIRLALWDCITRDLHLSTPSKSILLVIANYTDPRSSRANIPISLLVLKCNLQQSELSRLLPPLEACHWIESSRFLSDAGHRLRLYNLSPQLWQRALRGSTGLPEP